MLQNRQTNTMSPPAWFEIRSGQRRWWWAFKKTEFCTGKGVPREPCAHPETEPAGQTCSLSVFACANIPVRLLDLLLCPGTGAHMAVCCIMSARAFLWCWDQLINSTGKSKGDNWRGEKGEEGGREERAGEKTGSEGRGFQVWIALQSCSEATWSQRFTHT